MMKFSPSLSLKLYELFIRTQLFLQTQGKVFSAEGFPRFRTKIEQRSYPAPAPMPRNFSKLFHAQEQQLNGYPVFTIAPRQGKPSIHVIYTHGGAYFGALQSIHWEIIRKLVESLGAGVTVPIMSIQGPFMSLSAPPLRPNQKMSLTVWQRHWKDEAETSYPWFGALWRYRENALIWKVIKDEYESFTRTC